MLKGKTVLLGVSGSIAAYKIANLARLLKKNHATVYVLMTEHATNFITPTTFETLTGTKCLIDTFDRNFEFSVEHVALAKQADLFMLAPASANVIGKIACGIADDMLTTTIMACPCKKFIAPAMNTNMYNNPIVQDNIVRLKDFGYEFVEPVVGMLANGDTGNGKMADEETLLSYILRELAFEKDLAGKKILVIGSGKTAALALRYVFGYPGVQVAACSRNYSHAKRLREEFPKLEVIPYEGWRSKIGACDIVISATASPHLIVKREDFCPVHPMALLDLAAPRDIDTALAADPLVTLINLDTLQEIAEENQRQREHLVRLGARMVERELGETTEWLRLSRMDDTIGPLQQRCSAIVADGCAYLERKLELGAREQKLVKKVLHASLQRLLREPIREMKRLDTEEE
ncbi:MAG: bifunctional phosphopantothenoylcysteine decarboxylase/phosphopantothenate--cysteine ligase CoaBC, partial [Lachnospiraceae bacterium]|nr:bifunctional phosphopantothenoylcysteine decarboxylase/phosphopantothenate--cysteine ligase CoaBC [Lachnospiraceae bacterium]